MILIKCHDVSFSCRFNRNYWHSFINCFKAKWRQSFSASRNSNSNEINSLQLELLKIVDDVKNIKKQEKFSAAVMCAAVTDLREYESDSKSTSQININAQRTLTEALLEVGLKCVVYLLSNRDFDGKFTNVNKHAKYLYTTEYGRQKALSETELLKFGKAV